MASNKKTVAQRAVGLASPVMPAPVAQVIGTRWGSRLFILLLPFLLATGVLTITWNNGIPSVNFDRARAWVVGEQVGRQAEQEALRVAQDWRERQAAATGASAAPAVPQQAWGQPQRVAWQGQPAYQQPYPNPPAPQLQPLPPQQPAQPWGPSAFR
ncbi:MAG: hypothetical protein ACKOSQ_02330 [Planctomycetaceae bacterium]